MIHRIETMSSILEAALEEDFPKLDPLHKDYAGKNIDHEIVGLKNSFYWLETTFQSELPNNLAKVEILKELKWLSSLDINAGNLNDTGPTLFAGFNKMRKILDESAKRLK